MSHLQLFIQLCRGFPDPLVNKLWKVYPIIEEIGKLECQKVHNVDKVLRCIRCPGVCSLFCFNLEGIRYLEWMFAGVNFFHAFPIKSNRIFPNEKLKHLNLVLNILCRRNQANRDAELAALCAKIVQIFADCTFSGLG